MLTSTRICTPISFCQAAETFPSRASRNVTLTPRRMCWYPQTCLQSQLRWLSRRPVSKSHRFSGDLYTNVVLTRGTNISSTASRSVTLTTAGIRTPFDGPSFHPPGDTSSCEENFHSKEKFLKDFMVGFPTAISTFCTFGGLASKAAQESIFPLRGVFLIVVQNVKVESFYGGALTFQQARGLWRREYYGGLFTALPFYIAAGSASMQPFRASQNVTLTSVRICTPMSR